MALCLKLPPQPFLLCFLKPLQHNFGQVQQNALILLASVTETLTLKLFFKMLKFIPQITRFLQQQQNKQIYSTASKQMTLPETSKRRCKDLEKHTASAASFAALNRRARC
jgi:hypothetical protein